MVGDFTVLPYGPCTIEVLPWVTQHFHACTTTVHHCPVIHPLQLSLESAILDLKLSMQGMQNSSSCEMTLKLKTNEPTFFNVCVRMDFCNLMESDTWPETTSEEANLD